jgi:hypothetical protein
MAQHFSIQRPVVRPVLAPALTRWEVRGPDMPSNAGAGAAILAALHATSLPLVLEIFITWRGLAVTIHCPDPRRGPEVVRAILGAAPGLELHPYHPPALPPGLLRYLGMLSRHDTPLWAPLRCPAPGDTDPLAALAAAVQPLAEDESCYVCYRVAPARLSLRLEAQRLNG